MIFVLICSCFIFLFGFMMNSVSNHFFNFFVDMLLRPLKTNLKYEKKKILSSRTYCISFFLYSSFSSFITFSCTLFFSHNFLYLSSLSLSHSPSLSSVFLSLSHTLSLSLSISLPLSFFFFLFVYDSS